MSRPCGHVLTKIRAGITHGFTQVASFRKVGGKWRAEVARKGVRKSRLFDSKQEAKDWAARQEYLILNADTTAAATPLGDVFDRYAREVSPRKRGHRWEDIRLQRFRKDPIALVAMSDLRPFHFAEWRDQRLLEVAPASVHREMALISAVLNIARKEWGLIKSNPLADVSKPRKPPPRDRIASDRELEALAISAGDDLANATARAFHAFLFAIETGMRAGEIIGLTWGCVHLDARYCHLPMTKNGTARDVPLSTEAVRLLEALPHADPVFGLTSRQIDVLWRKLRDRAGVQDLTFHDSRHMAVVNLAKKLHVLDLARMIGHRDIRMLMTYYSISAQDLAEKLD